MSDRSHYLSSEITTLEKARELLVAGDASAAREMLTALIDSRRKQVASESLFLLGCSFGMSDDHISAAFYFERCLSISPKNLVARYNFAKSLEEQGSTSQAIRNYEAVLRRDPENQNAKLNCANCLLKIGQLAKAEQLYTQVLKVNPGLPSALTGLGCCLVERGDVLRGCELHSKAIQIEPNIGEFWNNRAVAFRKLARVDECLHNHSQALALSPNYRVFQLNWISSLLFFGRHDEALDALKDVPPSIRPTDKSLDEIRAEVYRARGELEVALSLISPLLKREQALPSSFNLYGLCLRDFGALDEARVAFEKVLKITPNDAAASFNLSLVLLESFEFGRGWVEYKSRWKTKDFPSDQFVTRKRESSGRRVNRLLVFGEQGVGEQLMFLHGLDHAKRNSNHVLASIDRRLVPLAKILHPEVVFFESNKCLNDSDFDEFCYAGDLFGRWHTSQLDHFQGLPAIPLPTRLQAAESGGRLRIGLSWRSKNRQFGVFKSPPIGAFSALSAFSNRAEFINLQYGWDQDEIESFGRLGINLITDELVDLYDDFLGTANLIRSCDVVVSVSNSVAHLSGAVGVRTFVLVPKNNGRLWYWQARNGQSYWYQGVTVFSSTDGWAAAIKDLCCSVEREFSLSGKNL